MLRQRQREYIEEQQVPARFEPTVLQPTQPSFVLFETPPYLTHDEKQNVYLDTRSSPAKTLTRDEYWKEYFDYQKYHKKPRSEVVFQQGIGNVVVNQAAGPNQRFIAFMGPLASSLQGQVYRLPTNLTYDDVNALVNNLLGNIETHELYGLSIVNPIDLDFTAQQVPTRAEPLVNLKSRKTSTYASDAIVPIFVQPPRRTGVRTVPVMATRHRVLQEIAGVREGIQTREQARKSIEEYKTDIVEQALTAKKQSQQVLASVVELGLNEYMRPERKEITPEIQDRMNEVRTILDTLLSKPFDELSPQFREELQRFLAGRYRSETTRVAMDLLMEQVANENRENNRLPEYLRAIRKLDETANEFLTEDLHCERLPGIEEPTGEEADALTHQYDRIENKINVENYWRQKRRNKIEVLENHYQQEVERIYEEAETQFRQAMSSTTPPLQSLLQQIEKAQQTYLTLDEQYERELYRWQSLDKNEQKFHVPPSQPLELRTLPGSIDKLQQEYNRVFRRIESKASSNYDTFVQTQLGPLKSKTIANWIHFNDRINALEEEELQDSEKHYRRLAALEANRFQHLLENAYLSDVETSQLRELEKQEQDLLEQYFQAQKSRIDMQEEVEELKESTSDIVVNLKHKEEQMRRVQQLQQDLVRRKQDIRAMETQLATFTNEKQKLVNIGIQKRRTRRIQRQEKRRGAMFGFTLTPPPVQTTPLTWKQAVCSKCQQKRFLEPSETFTEGTQFYCGHEAMDLTLLQLPENIDASLVEDIQNLRNQLLVEHISSEQSAFLQNELSRLYDVLCTIPEEKEMGTRRQRNIPLEEKSAQLCDRTERKKERDRLKKMSSLFARSIPVTTVTFEPQGKRMMRIRQKVTEQKIGRLFEEESPMGETIRKKPTKRKRGSLQIEEEEEEEKVPAQFQEEIAKREEHETRVTPKDGEERALYDHMQQEHREVVDLISFLDEQRQHLVPTVGLSTTSGIPTTQNQPEESNVERFEMELENRYNLQQLLAAPPSTPSTSQKQEEQYDVYTRVHQLAEDYKNKHVDSTDLDQYRFAIGQLLDEYRTQEIRLSTSIAQLRTKLKRKQSEVTTYLERVMNSFPNGASLDDIVTKLRAEGLPADVTPQEIEDALKKNKALYALLFQNVVLERNQPPLKRNYYIAVNQVRTPEDELRVFGVYDEDIVISASNSLKKNLAKIRELNQSKRTTPTSSLSSPRAVATSLVPTIPVAIRPLPPSEQKQEQKTRSPFQNIVNRCQEFLQKTSSEKRNLILQLVQQFPTLFVQDASSREVILASVFRRLGCNLGLTQTFLQQYGLRLNDLIQNIKISVGVSTYVELNQPGDFASSLVDLLLESESLGIFPQQRLDDLIRNMQQTLVQSRKRKREISTIVIE